MSTYAFARQLSYEATACLPRNRKKQLRAEDQHSCVIQVHPKEAVKSGADGLCRKRARVGSWA